MMTHEQYSEALIQPWNDYQNGVISAADYDKIEKDLWAQKNGVKDAPKAPLLEQIKAKAAAARAEREEKTKVTTAELEGRPQAMMMF